MKYNIKAHLEQAFGPCAGTHKQPTKLQYPMSEPSCLPCRIISSHVINHSIHGITFSVVAGYPSTKPFQPKSCNADVLERLVVTSSVGDS